MLLATGLASCASDGIQTVETGNVDVTCVKIATVEGRNVYRLRDGESQTVYFVVNPKSTVTSWNTIENKRQVAHIVESE